MAWPPPALPATRTNEDPQWDTHVADHNALAGGVNDIVTRIKGKTALRQQSNPNGSIPTATWTKCSVNASDFSYGEGIRGDTVCIWSDTPGLFLLMGHMYWNTSNGTGRRILGVSTSPTVGPSPDYYRCQVVPNTGNFQQQVIVPYRLPTPGQFHLWCYQDSGATITLTSRSLTVIRLTHPF